MAGKPKPMSQIKQLMMLHSQGKGRKTIARILGTSKNTFAERYGRIVGRDPEISSPWINTCNETNKTVFL